MAENTQTLIDEINSIPGMSSDTLQKIEEIARKLPNTPKETEPDPIYSDADLRDAIIKLVDRSKPAWEKGEDYGLVGTLVGKLEFFEGFELERALPWYK